MNVPKGPKNPTRFVALAAIAAKTTGAVAERAVPVPTWHDERVDELGLRALLDDVQSGAVSPDDAVARLRRLPFADVEGATVDHHRHLRSGLPEAIYGPGKSPSQCVAIVGELLAHGTGPVLLTRTDDAQRRPASTLTARRSRRAGAWCGGCPSAALPARVAVVTAGTSDIPVADEAALALRGPTASTRPSSPTSVSPACIDCSPDSTTSTDADALIVVAGMEGALASVLGGLTGAPVVAVPTSVGYGAGLDGVTALLAMHASCASGVTVVGHRQRLRRRVRDRPHVHVAGPMTGQTDGSPGSTARQASPAT